MASVNKVGLGSILVGLVLLVLVWFLGFSSQPSVSAAIVALVSTAFVGGLILFALFLILVGLLIIVV